MSSRTVSAAVAAVDAAGIPCGFIGALAMASYGIAQTTADADLLVVSERVLDHGVWEKAARRVTVDVRVGELDDLVLSKADVAGTIDHLDIQLVFASRPDRANDLIAYVERHLSLVDPYSRDRWRTWRAMS